MIINSNDRGIVTAWLLPHPPVAVPEVGRGRENEISNTLKAMRNAADYIVRLETDAIILVSPHAPMSASRIMVNGGSGGGGNGGGNGGGRFRGGLSQFGAFGVSLEFEGDGDLSALICEESETVGIKTGASGGKMAASRAADKRGGMELDHGAVVPLYFIDEAIRKTGAARPKLIVISIAYLANADLYRFGKCIADAANKSEKSVAFIASGDLSHKLTADGPYGYDPAGPEFDRFLIDCISRHDISALDRKSVV
jgi:aromatic ring-opening dioxygenase LigB subunit